MRYRVKIHRPIFGVPITFLDKHNIEQFELLGHEHDIHGNGGEGIVHGQFEHGGRGFYKRILIRQKEQTHEVQS